MTKDSWYDPSLYPDCNALLFFLSNRDAYRPTIFSTNEIFCGPDCHNAEHRGMIKSIRTPVGVYSIEPIVNILPPKQTPDVIIVKADATARNLPVHLHTLSCPKILILGNTQHLSRPIRMLIQYAHQEQFDWIITDHKRHHLHWFCEAGFKNVHWIPGFNVYPHPQPHTDSYDHTVTLVGQAGRWHPYRRHVLDHLKKHGMQVEHLQLPQQRAAQTYDRSKINLNCSLNGDMNLRVFEVLAAGGFLLTDTLSGESGLDLLFENNKHLCTYDSPTQLRRLITHYLENDEQREAIKRAGEQLFWDKHRPEQKAAELARCVFGGELTPEYKVSREKRCQPRTSTGQTLTERAALYEYVQELHLQRPLPFVCLSKETMHLACDLHDLPRLHIGVDGVTTTEWDVAKNEFISNPGPGAYVEPSPTDPAIWDLFITDSETVLHENFSAVLKKYPSLKIAVNGEAAKCDDALGAMGLTLIQDTPHVWGWVSYENFLTMSSGTLQPSTLLDILRSNLAGNVSDSERIHLLGLVAFRNQNHEAARQLLEQALFYAPQDRQLLLSTIHHYRPTEPATEALPYAQRLTALFPQEPEFWNLLGDLSTEASLHAQAIEAFRQSLRRKPNQPHISSALNSLEQSTPPQPTTQAGRGAFGRILVINNLFPPQELGGYGRLLSDFTDLLRKRGYDVHVLTSDTPYLGVAPSNEKHMSRTLELFGEWKQGTTRTFDQTVIERVIGKNIHTLESVLNSLNPDVCLFGNADFIGAELIHTLLNRMIPVLQHLGNPQPGYPPEHSPQSPLYRLACASRWLRDELWKKGYPLKNIDVIYPGALVGTFYQDTLPPSDILNIAYASIVLPYKGPQILLKALLELKSQQIPFHATIAGTSTDPVFVENLKAICLKAGLSDQVTFPGNLDRDQLVQMYRNHNVLVFPSLVSEAFGISQVEAMASGACVITSATGGAAEVVENNHSGLVFTSGDHYSLTEKLITLHTNHPLWDRLRARGRRRALEVFDIEHSVDGIEDIFGQLTPHKAE